LAEHGFRGPIVPPLAAGDAEALLRIAVEAFADGFAIFDREDRLVLCNSKYRCLGEGVDDYVSIGASFEYIHRRAIAEGHFPEAVGQEDEWLAHLLEEHRHPTGPREHRLADGRHMLVTKNRMENGWTAILRVDITALKQAEADAVRTREILAAIVDSADVAIIGTTLDGLVTSWNRSAEAIFGYTATEMIGNSVFCLAPPGREDDMKAILERIKAGERIDHYETQRRHRDGRLIEVSLAESPIYDGGGRLIGASKLSRDITAVKSAQDALRASESRLEELHAELLHLSRLSAMGQIEAMVTHEINQPLAAISNYLSAANLLIQKDGILPIPQLQEALRRAKDQSNRVGQLVQRLRAFASRGESEKHVVPVSPLVQEAAELAALGSRYRSMDIRMSNRMQNGHVLVDKVQIQQVLLNLLRNAADAVAEQDEQSIGLVLERAGNDVWISVVDNGPGLTEEVANRLFQPFVSTKRNGMGLGLSICKSIVDTHGGRLWAEANPTGGTIFRVALPLLEDVGDSFAA
jgi:two-component system sensor kinase FixL